MQAHRLLKTQIQIFQLRDGRDRNLPLTLERPTNLLSQSLVGVRTLADKIQQRGRRARARLAARHDKHAGVHAHLVARQRAVLQVRHEVAHEVLLCVRGLGQALEHPLAGQLPVALRLRYLFLAHEQWDQDAQPGILAQQACHGDGPQRVEDEADPGVQLAALEAVEGLAEGQLAGDVEGRVVDPLI